MLAAPIPQNEKERLESLKKLKILDTPPEERFDRITKLATKIFNVPISTISLVDANREWFKSVCGLNQKEGDRAISFCGHAMLSDEILLIPNALEDPRFSDNPMVVGEPFIRFYAGVPLFSSDGQRIGTFCLKDKKPRKFSVDNIEDLKGLAKWAEVEINDHNLVKALESVKKSTYELDSFFNLSEDLMCIASTDGFFKRVNPKFTKLLGYSEKELLSKPFFSFIHPEDRDVTTKEIQKLASGARTINFRVRFINKDSIPVWLEWNATPENNKLYAIARDITYEKLQQEAIKNKSSELERLNRVMVDRELKMIELKEAIKELKSKK